MSSKNMSNLYLPEPLHLPWQLKPVTSADYGVESLSGGRKKYWIRHEELKGVTPRMLQWWFSNLEGDVTIGGRRYNRYRVWHPRDHIQAGYAWRRPDGSIGPGAGLRIQEVLGRDLRHVVDITSTIEELDEDGFVHTPAVHAIPGMPAIRGLARMEYRFRATPSGTLYENCLILGSDAWWGPIASRFFIPEHHGERWFRHNIEEAGAFEEFLPAVYHRETGKRS